MQTTAFNPTHVKVWMHACARVGDVRVSVWPGRNTPVGNISIFTSGLIPDKNQTQIWLWIMCGSDESREHYLRTRNEATRDNNTDDDLCNFCTFWNI